MTKKSDRKPSRRLTRIGAVMSRASRKQLGVKPTCLNRAEACWFWRPSSPAEGIPAVQRLLQRCQGPLYEVRIIRESWQQPIGQLKVGSIGGSKAGQPAQN
jgi:hypothetical protein